MNQEWGGVVVELAQRERHDRQRLRNLAHEGRGDLQTLRRSAQRGCERLEQRGLARIVDELGLPRDLGQEYPRDVDRHRRERSAHRRRSLAGLADGELARHLALGDVFDLTEIEERASRASADLRRGIVESRDQVGDRALGLQQGGREHRVRADRSAAVAEALETTLATIVERNLRGDMKAERASLLVRGREQLRDELAEWLDRSGSDQAIDEGW